MPAKRTTMRKIRDVLRLRLSAGLSIRAISRSTKISVGGIQKLLTKASTLELGWPLPDDLDQPPRHTQSTSWGRLSWSAARQR